MIALFTKETAIFLPVICVLYLHLIIKEKIFSRRELALIVGWFFVITFWFYIRKACLPNPVPMDIFSMGRNMIRNSPALIQFTGKAIFPFNLSVLPIIQDTTFIYGFAALLFIASILVISRKARYNFVIFGALWFILFLVPSFIRPNPAIVADFMEHRTYLPILGIIIICSEASVFRDMIFNKRIAFALSAFLIVLFSAITFNYSENFRDRLTFWQGAVRTSPHSLVAHINLGLVYELEGMNDKAVKEFREASALVEKGSITHNYLGIIYMKQGMFSEAETEFKKALATGIRPEEVRQNLANLYFKEGKLKELEELLKGSRE